MENGLFLCDDEFPTAEEVSKMPMNMTKSTFLTFTFDVENTWNCGSSITPWSQVLCRTENRDELLETIRDIVFEELCKDLYFVVYDRALEVDIFDVDCNEYMTLKMKKKILLMCVNIILFSKIHVHY